MKPLYLLVLSFCYLPVKAQKEVATTNPESRWSIGTNPLGFLEPEAAIGLSGAYRLSPHFELWTEPSILSTGFNSVAHWHSLSGYRLIVQPRYYPNKRSPSFFALEWRLKHYHYTNTATFINDAAGDTLINYRHKVSQALSGGALVFGSQATLSRKHNMYLEFTIGIGAKVRVVKRLNIPAGYQYNYPRRHYAFTIDYEQEGGAIYVPLGFRLIWKLK